MVKTKPQQPSTENKPTNSNDISFETTKKQQPDRPRADPSYRWGVTVTPSKETPQGEAEIGKDHPVHKIPLEKQEKMRAKGINPVLKAEMDEAMKGQGGFWAKVGMTSFGGGWIK